MSIPPIPSQDLAKLVLGYLAEEQLMTAYDEFLQTSPYLDALGNEYDRIFMTSLRNILAEYRAIKIFVETCKPFALRRKMFQCANLLEMVKFLIQYVDINKIQLQENSSQSKYSVEKHSSSSNGSTIPSNTHISTSHIESSVETTALADLPGSHVTYRKKNVRVLNKDLSEVNTDVIESTSKLPIHNEIIEKTLSNTNHATYSPMGIYSDPPQNMCIMEKPDSMEMRQKEEFNNILNEVCNKNEHIETNIVSQIESIEEQNKASIAGYDAFATGVNSGGNAASITVPDSSTSESVHVQIPTPKEMNKLINLEQNTKVTKTQKFLLKVANVKNNGATNEAVSINTVNKCTVPRSYSKTDESKVKILSDIKVDKTYSNSEASGSNVPKMPTVLRNTSTPVLQMQTIVINGTPVYKNKPFPPKSFTKDEIMAMPTIILAPVPDPLTIPVSEPSDTGPDKNVPTSASSSSSRTLGQLVIDVTSNKNTYVSNTASVSEQNIEKKLPVEESNKEINQNENTVIKSGDITSASAPKDNTVAGTTETSTPQVLPPVRKTASTPRRTSHVRVLDFTTPRRVLHETINKCVPHLTLDGDKEVVLSKSPNVATSVTVEQVENNKVEESKAGSLKENNNIKKSNKRWDADLRVLATAQEKESTNTPSTTKKKPKPKSTKKSKPTKDELKKKIEKSTGKDNNKKKSSVSKLPEKSTSEEVDVITIHDEKLDVPIKPTINIISGIDHSRNTSSENSKSQNKSNNEDNIDTPEMERISLQNEIGVKLNISDLLETPYKQALYDIQMETPRFLGPDIPDDPMSDIKIMNIPTPRFLTTAATPSSYSSRPTDYSSGGSYYKPEDQDYMRIHDEPDCVVTSSKESVSNDVSNNKDNDDCKEKENLKPSRPVRECTKNVSYYNAHSGVKSKQSDNKTDMDSSFDSTDDRVIETAIPSIPATPKIKESKNKSDVNKKGSSKKRKTPVKKEAVKSFMKIKPRRPTPTKNNVRGKKKSGDSSSFSKVQSRKKTGKESVNVTPVINSVPTKSRRKSSTPRKLHCGKSFHSESSGNDSPEFESKSKEKVTETNVPDSDTEQLALRWSDDGSQEPQPVVISIPNDMEDIKHIKEYIQTSEITNEPMQKEVSLHIDLVKRGFDLETAKSIERDLLDTPPHHRNEVAEPEFISSTRETEKDAAVENIMHETVLEKTLESDCSNNLRIVQNDEDEIDEEIELSVHECNEDSTNYVICSHDDTKDKPKSEVTLLKDKYTVEVCIDDGVSIRLIATPFSVLIDQEPQSTEYLGYSYRETEMAVNSISNFDKLYTPLKESIKAQCYEIFDSTLTSLDTPLKARSPRKIESEVTVTEIVLEVEKIEEKSETKKRKRVQSGNVSDESGSDSKKIKPDAQLLFNSTNIQNFDIDSVLSKLHGP